MAEPTRPHRRHTLEINIQGDTWEDVMQLLRSTFMDLTENDRKGDSVHGGVSAGGLVRIKEDPTMTPEKYQQELDEYCELTSGF